MGLVKSDWMEAQDRGWTAPEKFVCAECVGDEFLADIVNSNLSADYCSYCNKHKETLIATEVENIMPPVAGAFFHYFADPSLAGLPRDSGEWFGEELITDTADAFLSLGWECRDELFEDVCDSFMNDAWFPCSDGWWLGMPENMRRKYAWESFVRLTKHKTRYFFLNNNEEDFASHEGYPPSKILEIICGDILRFDMLKELPPGTDLYRVRTIFGNTFNTFSELGPPPPHLASAGRMNPPGISYGYFASSERTAVLEVCETPPTELSIGKFKLKKPLMAIDLTTIPTPPSIFDGEKMLDRDCILFLQSFVKAIATPIAKKGRQHIDYVPSQILSEYFYQILRLNAGKSVGALLYPSSLDPSGSNIVIFPSRDISDSWDTLFELCSAKKITFDDWGNFNNFLS
jgi:hypothetical protein